MISLMDDNMELSCLLKAHAFVRGYDAEVTCLLCFNLRSLI